MNSWASIILQEDVTSNSVLFISFTIVLIVIIHKWLPSMNEARITISLNLNVLPVLFIKLLLTIDFMVYRY